MAEYPVITPVITPVINPAVVHGTTNSTGRASAATLQVLASASGRPVLVVRNQYAGTGAGISAAVTLDEEGRRQAIKALGGTP